MGLDPHGDRLFLLHLLEIYGYDTLMVSDQLCCSWETTWGWAFSSAALLAFLDHLSPQMFLWYRFLFLYIYRALHLVTVAALFHNMMRCKEGVTTWCSVRNFCGLEPRRFRSKRLNAMDGRSKAKKRTSVSAKVDWTAHKMTKEEIQRNPVITSRQNLRIEVWKCTCEASFLWKKKQYCFSSPFVQLVLACVWNGLRLSADVAFLVSSAGFKHLFLKPSCQSGCVVSKGRCLWSLLCKWNRYWLLSR